MAGPAGAVTRGQARGEENVMATTAKLARRHPRKATTAVLWVIGIAIMLFAPAPVKITKEMAAAYEAKLDELTATEEHYHKTWAKLDRFEQELRREKTFLWRFSAEKRASVREIRERMKPTRDEMDTLDKHRKAIESDAKAILGLWSEAGVEETRDLFWKSYRRGKQQAQRGILWDMVFELFREDNYENGLGYLIRAVFIVVANFFYSLLAASLGFCFRLYWVISSFQAGWTSSLVFFLVAALAGVSTMAGIFSLVAGAGAGAVYVVARQAASLEGPEQRRRQEYIRQRAQGMHRD